MRLPRNSWIFLGMGLAACGAGPDAPVQGGTAGLAGRVLVSVAEPLPEAIRLTRPAPSKDGSGLIDWANNLVAASGDAATKRDIERIPEPSLNTAPDLEAALIDALIRQYGARGVQGGALDDQARAFEVTANGAMGLASTHPGELVAVNVRVESHEIRGISGRGEGEATYFLGTSYSAGVMDLATGALLAEAACEVETRIGTFPEIQDRGVSLIDIAAIGQVDICAPQLTGQIVGGVRIQ
ncbi:MAG: hypothetical protein AAF415_18670 [Pseudomonadota bacterium]